MLQGTVEDAAWKISENGFGTVATRDAGYYGKGFFSPFSRFSFLYFSEQSINQNNHNQGIYFTSTFEYANRYAGISNGMKVFMISLVIPGNPYPVTEYPFKENEIGKILEYNPDGFYGKACQPGYQSHFTLSLDLSFHCSNLKQTSSNKQQTTHQN